MLDQHPDFTPDEVEALLVASARPLKGKLRSVAPVPLATPTTLGTGSLEASRGNRHLTHGGVVFEGEQDIFGNPWHGASWVQLAAHASWSGASWSGASWSGASWSGALVGRLMVLDLLVRRLLRRELVISAA